MPTLSGLRSHLFLKQKTLFTGLLPIKNEKAKSLNERFAAYFEVRKGINTLFPSLPVHLLQKYRFTKRLTTKLEPERDVVFEIRVSNNFVSP